MRLIDADALLLGVIPVTNSKGRVTWSAVPAMDVLKAPTIDAVPVVRCKDCKHYMEYPLNKVDKRMCCYVHLLAPHFTPEGGFCSYGEKRDEEDRSE